MNRKQWLLLILLSLLWGATFITAKIALSQYEALSVVFWRVSLAAIALFMICLMLKQPIPASAEIWKAFLGMSLLNNMIPMFLLFWSMHELSSSLAAILNATTPLFTVLVMHYGTEDEKAKINKVIGVIIGFIGVVILTGFNNDAKSLLAVLACLGATLSYALSAVWGKRFRKMKLEPIHIAFGQLTCSTIVLGAICIIGGYNTFQIPKTNEVWLSIIVISMLSTALAYIIFFYILNTAGGNNVMLVTFLVPISAIILGSVFLKEVILLRHILGMLVIGIGLLFIDGRLLEKIRV